MNDSSQSIIPLPLKEEAGFKVCTKCKEEKSLIRFPKRYGKSKGISSWCRECMKNNTRVWYRNNVDRAKAASTKWFSDNPEKAKLIRKKAFLKHRYGITPEQVEKMQQSQEGLCACCKIRPAKLIDHNHTTGKVRDLLCSQCNTVVGFLEINIGISNLALEYIKKHG